MKKIFLTFAFLIGFVSNSYSATVGFTVSMANIDSDLSDDIDSNGTTDTTKSVSNDVNFASIFVENGYLTV